MFAFNSESKRTVIKPTADVEELLSELSEPELLLAGEQRPQRSVRRWAVPGVALALVAVIGVVVSRGGATGSADATSKPGVAVSLVESKKPEAKAAPAAAPDDSKCSAPGTSCLSTQCCKAGGKNGTQCFKKSDNWAECMEACEPGVHEGEKEGTYDASGTFQPVKWTCEKLGPHGKPDPCSAPGDDCSKSKCCSSAFGGNGMTCFEKDKNYATCKETCDPKANETKGWSCDKLGERTKWDAGCSWAGKACTNLCCNVGFVCAVKDADFTGCVQTTMKTTWITKNIPMPGGWEGTVKGGGRNEYSVPAAGAGQPVAGDSLYCFMAYLPGTYEDELYREAFRSKAGIYACDAYDTFHAWQSSKNGWDTGEATLSNTDVFIDVWNHVIESGKYLDYAWTVKSDADAVLLPGRLKAHIRGLNAPAYRAIYLKNNGMDPGMGNNGFLGAVEVFSKQAVQIYGDNWEGCKTSLGLTAGEDGFMKGCMDALGVGFMMDSQLFNPDKSAGACNLGQRAAFHPLKTGKDWKCCLDITNGIMHTVDYGNCNMDYSPPPPTPEEQAATTAAPKAEAKTARLL